MSKITNPVKIRYVMNNSDLNVVGEQMGYDWNEICDEISNNGLQGSDGDGAVTVYKNRQYNKGEILNSIINKLFEMNPDVQEIYIIDDF